MESITVKKIEIPQGMNQDAVTAFRTGRAHTIEDIRSAFKLTDKPLMAFSFKPRVGIRFEELEHVTLNVLRNGFNLVELDIRNLAISENEIEKLINLAKKSAELDCGHVTRFSPNLSISAPLVTELTEKFMAVQEAPVVIKIDGGLDGISSCQTVRKKCSGSKSPIITCYPLLRKQLGNRITSEFFVKALALSGADIIYPGGRPNLGSPSGLGESEKGDLKKLSTKIPQVD